MNTLWDTHCHLTGYRDPIAILDEATQADVDVVAVTEDPGEYRLLRARLGRRSGVTPALGMHPLRAHSFTPADLARFLRMLSQATWIGEVGLDFSPAGRATRNAQTRIFEAILGDPRARSLPMTIHSRGAEKEIINRLLQIDVSSAILHWYTGPATLIDNALVAGAYFSFNPAMTATAKGQTLLGALPMDRVLLETDGPFTRVGARPARPGDLPRMLGHLAARWALSPDDVIRQVRDNQQRLHTSV
ncbi:TatD family hydrolase [Streptomyces paludis]|uniref:TatD family deoxyribonuclease n=1 Tax=Streptomyces paludis TaxID=2282738 RepID=A0A345HPF0_9ACTN|nr:TatD family hydrolase [Streptomyces paludis]AXG78574.1 TatD family deoxyribonuclease [Streptomyces paludis]